MPSKLKAFESLKRHTTNHSITSTASAKAIHLQIKHLKEVEGTWIQIVDPKGTPTTADYRSYTGNLRAILKQIDALTLSQESTFSWETEARFSEAVQLNEEHDLLDELMHCDCLVDANLKPISSRTEQHTIKLALSRNDEQSAWTADFQIQPKDSSKAPKLNTKTLYLSDRHLITNNQLIATQRTGGHSQEYPLFNDKVPDTQLESFLSLFASRFRHIPIELNHTPCPHTGSIDAKPVIAFKEVDEQGTLYLELTNNIPPLDEAFTQEFEISTLAHRVEDQIELKEINYQTALAAQSELVAKLEKDMRSNKKSDAWISFEADGQILLSQEAAEKFLSRDVTALIAHFKIIGANNLARYKVKYIQPKLSVSLSSGIDFLEGDATLSFDEEKFSILDAIRQYQKNGYVTLADGHKAMLDSQYMARLERIFKKNKKGVRVSIFDLPAIEESFHADLQDSAIPKTRQIFEDFNQIHKRKTTTPRLKGTLRSYQKAGLKWMDYLYKHRLGGCLADDMGLGKTIQTIALLTRIYPKAKRPTLLIMPRSLLFNWSRELEKFAPHLKFTLHYGTSRDWEQATQHQIILSTYGTIRADIQNIQDTDLHALILDESQAIKNSTSQTYKAVRMLKSEFHLALSGTPIENNLGELYSLFSFLNPAMFKNLPEFERDYLTPIQKQQDTEAAEDLKRKIRPFILRRLKQEVLKDLPDKVEQTLYVDMSAPQKQHYETRRLFYKELIRNEVSSNGLAKSRMTILEALLELRQIATIPEHKSDGIIKSAKIERLIEAATEAIENGHKCLIFTNFLAGIELICQAFNQSGIQHISMTGATNNREALVSKFQNDPAIKAFVMTLKTGGVGLNLVAADRVFILDPWWNQSAENQAVDRAHRMGQKNSVFTYRLITRDTIEEKIQQLQAQKKELVDQIVTTDSESFKQLSESDIDALFSA